MTKEMPFYKKKRKIKDKKISLEEYLISIYIYKKIKK